MRHLLRLLTAACLLAGGGTMPVSASNLAAEPGDVCLSTASHALRQLQSYPGGVPDDVAGPLLRKVAGVCVNTDVSGLVDVVPSLPLVRCAGGGLTITGWSNVAYLLGVRVHLLNEAASSFWSYLDGAAAGYARSTTNNFEVAGDQALWDWLNIPMKGEAALELHCLAGVVTRAHHRLEGSPVGVPPSILRVVAGGVTCLVPC